MAGRKVFTSGEILTAADVNSYLMNQVVAVFADSTARSSAIPSPSEGMVTFREDQDVVEVYDGSAFKTVGGLVAVKSALFTGAQTASVNGGDSVAVTDLSITHALSDASNKLLIFANLGIVANSLGLANTGLRIQEGSNFIGAGDASGSRHRVNAGGGVDGNTSQFKTQSLSASVVHEPGSTSSLTYTVHAVNIRESTQTVFINRAEDEATENRSTRSASSMILMEVAV